LIVGPPGSFLAGLKFGAFDALPMASSPSSQGQKVVGPFVTCEVQHFVHSFNVKGTCWKKKRGRNPAKLY